MFQELCSMLHIKNVYSTAYHAASQGETERCHRTLLGQLRNFVSTTQKDWDSYIPALIFSINATENQLRGYSAFMLVFGRTPIVPPEIDLPEGLEGDRTVLEHLADIVETQARCNLFAEQHLREQSLKMKAQYDKHATENPIHPGDTVFVFQPKLQVRLTKRKLQRNYHGPYMVSEYNTQTTVILRRLSDGKYLPKSIHVSRLKKGHVRARVNTWDPIPDVQGQELTEDDLPGNSFDPYTTNDDAGSDSESEEVLPRRPGLRPRQPHNPQDPDIGPQPTPDQPNTVTVQAEVHPPPPQVQKKRRGRPRKNVTTSGPTSTSDIVPPNTSNNIAGIIKDNGVLTQVTEVLNVRPCRHTNKVQYLCKLQDGTTQWTDKDVANDALRQMAVLLEKQMNQFL